MDLYCGNCGEPWDLYSVRDVQRGEDNDPAWKLNKHGHIEVCPCCPKDEDGRPIKQEIKNQRAQLSVIAASMMGDDLDGAAAMMEDAGDLVF